MVQKGEAKLDCDKDCDVFKANQEKLATKEDEIKKQEELRAQQVTCELPVLAFGHLVWNDNWKS